jgi:DNA repair protein RadC
MEISLLERTPKISTPGDLVRCIPRDLLEEKREFFGVVYLNTKNVPVHHEVVSIGTLNSCVVHPREVFRRAVVESAAAVITVHNHPSGDLEPSPDDLALSRNLVRAGEILGIDVLDHLIVNSKREFRSFKEMGYI